jgi:PPOX class probable F420-dependent enzyme
MSVSIPESHRDLLERPIYATVTTVMPDGQPQSTVVWVDAEGDRVRFSVGQGRQKIKNLQANPRVTFMLIDPDNPYRWMEIRGKVVEMNFERGHELIEALSWKYMGQPYYGGFNARVTAEQDPRLFIAVQPTKITTFGR